MVKDHNARETRTSNIVRLRFVKIFSHVAVSVRGLRSVLEVKRAIITIIDIQPSDLLKGPARSMAKDW